MKIKIIKEGNYKFQPGQKRNVQSHCPKHTPTEVCDVTCALIGYSMRVVLIETEHVLNLFLHRENWKQ